MQGIGEGAAILTARIVRYAILLVGIGVAFAFLGASVQPLIAVALIVGAVVVLALRGISANFAAGLVLQTRHPIKVGDEIEVGGYVGAVRELNGRSVVIVTRDGRNVHIPNSQVLESPLVNHSELGLRRSDVEVRVQAGAEGAEPVRSLIAEAVASVEGVDKARAGTVLLQSSEPDRVVLLVRFWHHPLAAPAICSPVVQAIADALHGAGHPAVVTSALPAVALTPPPRM
nr:mechanosensitive ion channel domain-containing protein [Herbiconiux flava]